MRIKEEYLEHTLISSEKADKVLFKTLFELITEILKYFKQNYLK